MNIKIANARPSEIRPIQRVFYATWLATYPNTKAGITVADIKHRWKGYLGRERLAKRRAMIENLPRNQKYLVATVGKRIVGVCIAARHKDRNQLRAIYVLPRYQGHGIGRALWEEVHRFFNKNKKTIVRVATYNKGAIAFYKKIGFRMTKKRIIEERLRMKSGSIIPQVEMVMRARRVV